MITPIPLNQLVLFSTSGFIVFCFQAIEFLGLQGKPYDWARYVTLVTIFPILLILAHSKQKYARWLQIAGLVFFGLFFLRFGLYSLPPIHTFEILFLSFLTAGVLGFSSPLHKTKSIYLVLFLLFISMFGWEMAAKLTFWVDFFAWSKGHSHPLIVFSLSVLAALAFFRTSHQKFSKGFNITDGIAYLTFFMASFRTDQLVDEWCRHHWDVYIGPANLIQQGGWIFWDVPSQYGFLSILSIVGFPGVSNHQAFYMILAIAHWVSAFILFSLLRRYSPGVKGYFFSLFVTLATIYFMPGWWPTLIGSASRPSTGSYRFIWCYVLGFLLFKALEFRNLKQPISNKFYLYFNTAWILGCLWSVESAVYSTCIWLPAYLIFKKRDLKQNRKIPLLIYFCKTPALAWGITLSLICLYYFIRIHHLPDPASLVEYARSFSLVPGFAMVVNNFGLAWWLVFLFVCQSTLLALAFQKRSDDIELGVLTSALAMTWAASSYFMGRSHDNNIINIFPVLTFAFILTLYTIRVSKLENWTSLAIQTFAVSTFAIVMTGTYGNMGDFQNYLKSIPTNSKLNVEPFLSKINPEIQGLIKQAKLTPEDKILYFQDTLLESYQVEDSLGALHWVKTPIYWLPISPPTLLNPLPDNRKHIYIDRFSSRRKMEGWIVSPKNSEVYPWFQGILKGDYEKTQTYESDHWSMAFYRRKN